MLSRFARRRFWKEWNRAKQVCRSVRWAQFPKTNHLLTISSTFVLAQWCVGSWRDESSTRKICCSHSCHCPVCAIAYQFPLFEACLTFLVCPPFQGNFSSQYCPAHFLSSVIIRTAFKNSSRTITRSLDQIFKTFMKYSGAWPAASNGL